MALPEALTSCPIVLLTGSGVSVPLGLDTTVEFRQRVFDTQLRDMDSGADREFFKFMLDCLSGPGATDIEVVLARLEKNAEWCDKLASDPRFVEKVLFGSPNLLTAFAAWNEKLADRIRDQVIYHYGNVDPAKAHALYRGLLEVYEYQMGFDLPKTLPFFTLNYDTAVEEACTRLGVRLVDGFVDGPFTGRRWSPAAFTGYEVDPARLNCVLVKLHGSVRLGRRPDGELVELPTGLDRDPSPNTHAVLYPSLSPKALGDEPFRTNYRVLRACFGRARLLVVIGCSLRDQELNDVIRQSMDENDDLHLLNVGPEVDVNSLAHRVGFDLTRVGGARGYWEVESEETIRSGQARMFNAIRRWYASALDARGASPHRFGENTEF